MVLEKDRKNAFRRFAGKMMRSDWETQREEEKDAQLIQ